MSNIVVTTYCNLRCPYCFASEMIDTERTKNVSPERFKQLLEWIGADTDRIGLIGGEPTLHPQFSELLKLAKEYSATSKRNTWFWMFTNGVYFEQYLDELPENLEVWVNVNQPQAMTKEQFTKMMHTLQAIKDRGWFEIPGHPTKAIVGCNICKEIDDYSFIWNVVKRFDLKIIRMSVVAPTRPELWEDKDKYYLMMKPKFLQFCKDAKECGVKLYQDCNQIPLCYYEPEELEFVNSVLTEPVQLHLCPTKIDITPDFYASPCFGIYQLFDCSKFETYKQLETFIKGRVMLPHIDANNGGICAGCEKKDLLICQGGCFGFSKDEFARRNNGEHSVNNIL